MKKTCKIEDRTNLIICGHYQLYGGGVCNLFKADYMCKATKEKEGNCFWFKGIDFTEAKKQYDDKMEGR